MKAPRGDASASASASYSDQAPLTEADRHRLDAFELLQQGAAIFDQQDRLAGYNESYAAIWPAAGKHFFIGMPRSELLGVLWDHYARWPGLNRDDWIKAMLADRTFIHGPLEREISDGRLFRMQRVMMDDGRVLASMIDITETAGRPENFDQRARSFREAALSAADWLWETDAEHRLQQPAFAPGGLRGEIAHFQGKTRWEALGIDADSDPVWSEHRDLLAAHRPFRDFRYSRRRPDGTVQHSRISGSPMFNGQGRFLGHVGIGVDETQIVEADLRANMAETRVQEVIDSLSEGIALHDIQGRLVLWNRTFESIYQRSPLSLRSGMSWEEVVSELARSGLIEHPGMTTSEWRDKRVALPRPNPETVERRIDGNWYLIRERATPSGGIAILMTNITELKEQQAELIQARDTLEDRVAERTRSLADAVARSRAAAEQRREAETRLKVSEQKFRSIAEGATQGFYVQQDFELVYTNPALAKLLGYETSADVMALGSIDGFLSPDVRKKLRQRSSDRMAGKDVPPRYETRFLRKDGTEFWVELFVSRITWEGRSSVLVSVADIEARKRAQDALTEAERDYRAIFEHASDGIYRSSIEGKNLRANPALARMNGFDGEDDVHGASVDLEGSWYVKPGRREEFVEAMQRDGEVRNFVSEVYRYKTREKIWISENARLIRDEGGNPLYFEGTVRDITEQRQAEMKLREAIAEAERANHAKSQFLAKMSHELRTPLNAIIGFSDIIGKQMMGPIGTDRYIDYASDIRNSGEHLLSLINDLLDLSKIESGELKLDLQPVDLCEILQDSASLVAPLADARNISLHCESGMTEARVLADRRSVKQMMLNLLSNAVKFNRDGGWIEVRAVPLDRLCRITVTDNGVGISKSELHSLFTPFGQVGNQMLAEQSGTGLGLPIVKSLVELHGGRIYVESEPGTGTTMTVELPLAA